MAQFIEVTPITGGQQLINIDKIDIVADRGDMTSTLVIREYGDEGVFTYSLEVKESYENIRNQMDVPKSSAFGS